MSQERPESTFRALAAMSSGLLPSNFDIPCSTFCGSSRSCPARAVKVLPGRFAAPPVRRIIQTELALSQVSLLATIPPLFLALCQAPLARVENIARRC